MTVAPLALRRLAALLSEVIRKEKAVKECEALDFATLSRMMDIISKDRNNFWFTDYSKEIHGLSVDYSGVWNPGNSELSIFTGYFSKKTDTFIIDPANATLNVSMGPTGAKTGGASTPDLVLHSSSLREQQQTRLSSTVIHRGQNFSVRTFEPVKQEVHAKVPNDFPRKSVITAGARKNVENVEL
jgi:hypothetical protein